MMTRKELHEIEMKLVELCEDNDVMREAILEYFTELINRCKNGNNKT